MTVPNLTELKTHMNETSDDHDTELTFMLEAAEALLDAELSRVGASAHTPTAESTNAIIRFAVYEIVRDMWQGTQSGAGAGRFGQDISEDALFTAGRPAISPYIASLLAPLIPVAGPSGSFPVAEAWPDPLGCPVRYTSI